MKKKSAGILLYRKPATNLEFFLVHPGGPFWQNKDRGAWSIPKGEITDEEQPLVAAIREFKEETGKSLSGDFIELKPIAQKSGKIVYAWAIEGDIDPQEIRSNLFELEWPPKSGRFSAFPEIDRGAWFNLNEAQDKLISSQLPFLKQIAESLNYKFSAPKPKSATDNQQLNLF